jgi:hypothetical protein
MRSVSPSKRSIATAGALGLALAVTVAVPGPAQADSTSVVVMQHLMNPRGVAIAANGTVYVAEAGTGGLTGQIQAFNPATSQSRVLVSGLTSLGGGSEVLGVSGLATQGSTVYAIMGESSNVIPAEATGTFADTARAQLGRLLMVTPSGKVKAVADVGAYDYAWTADHLADPPADVQDANPYGLLVTPGNVLVADAGANAITGVSANGSLSDPILVPTPASAFLSDAVPTCIAPNGQGGYWIGTLNGTVHSLTGTSVGDPIALTGDPFVSIGGCVSDGNGGLYVTDQIAFFASQPGGVYHVSSDGVVSTVLAGAFGPSGFISPCGIALTPDGKTLYVAVNSVSPDAGQLLKITL